MCPANEVQIVTIQKLGHDIRSEGERDAAIVFAPTLNVLVWI